MKKIFLEKPYTRCDEETILKLFSKKLKLSIRVSESIVYCYSLFLLYV